MSKSQLPESQQLSFAFEAPSTNALQNEAVAVRHNVVHFVDRRTSEIRRQAVERVASSGIFSLPPNLLKRL